MAILAAVALVAGCAGEPPYRATLDTDLDTKPRVQMPRGEPPTELVIQDIVRGDGAVAPEGATVLVHYVGVSWNERSQIDSSWEGGEPVRFSLDEVIEGWTQGIPGMRVGGRRGLVIPPELAYEDGDPLVFVIDLMDVEEG